jgi:hypothetical protein
MYQDYLSGTRLPNFLYPSAVDNFKRQFAFLEGQAPPAQPAAAAGAAAAPGYGQQGGGGGGAAAGRGGMAAGGRPIMAATSLPRERVGEFQAEAAKYSHGGGGQHPNSHAIYSSSSGGALQTGHYHTAAGYSQHYSQPHQFLPTAPTAALGGQQQQAPAAQSAAAAAAAYQQQQYYSQQQQQQQQQLVGGSHHQSHGAVAALGNSVGNLSVDDHLGVNSHHHQHLVNSHLQQQQQPGQYAYPAGGGAPYPATSMQR